MMDGLALAGRPVVEPDVSFVNLDDGDVEPWRGELTAWDLTVISGWWQTARFDVPEPVRGPLPPEEILERLGTSRYFAGIPADELKSTLAAMRAFLFERRAADRVLEAMGDGADVVIGHALGAVAAFNALRRAPADALVTVGSPLALNPQVGPVVRRWCNVVDVHDTLAFNEGLVSSYGLVSDTWLDCDPRLRAPRPYLASPEFGRVLADVSAPAVAPLG
ncbi:hypothetical protein [Actinomadura harenae]|uniref:Alpha/beta hydrolase n=1 Tax=Actinomadura harenae TaxID=2483351 RepID=A0A3M2LR59_9ACTN|nr:hypothetical protein [Actinomadura harenae]RMI38575.1 hypothetical protein EBO15_32500 [Actinomadura harenae]